MSHDETILSVDIGTSSLKAALVSSDGTVKAFSQQYFTVPDTKAIANQWLFALRNTVASFSSLQPTIVGICVSGNGPTLVAQDGTTLLWNSPLSDELTQQTTSHNSKSLFLPRILAFKTIYPTIWNTTPFLYSGPEYVLYKLSGTSVTILPEKRYISAYWTEQDLRDDGIPVTKLPPYASPAQSLGHTTDEACTLLGLSHPIPVFCGAPDFVVALVGTNTLHVGAICDRAGSSEGLNLCTATPFSDPHIRTLPSILPDLWNASVLLPASGKRFSEYKAQIEQETKQAISYNDLIRSSYQNPQCHGYTILTTLANTLREGIITLQKNASKAGIALAPVITVTGGQTKSPDWMQIKANLISYPLGVTSCNDAELIGDAILGWVGLGTYKTIQQAADAMVSHTTVYQPQNTVQK